MPRLTAVVVTFGHEDEIGDCLDALLASTVAADMRIVVVDNASTDRTTDVVRSYGSAVQLVELPQNVGYAAANNIALSEAAGEFLALINPDTRVAADALEIMSTYLLENPGVGSCAAWLTYADGQNQYFARREPTLGDVLWDLTEAGARIDRALRGGRGSAHRRYRREFEEATGPFEVDCPAAACVVLWRAVVGSPLFDERFPLLFNDADLFRRLRVVQGYSCHVLPTARAVHLQGTSLTRLHRDRLRAEFVGSLCSYAQRHWRLAPSIALRALLLIDAWTCWLLGSLPHAHRQRLWAQARGNTGGLGLGRCRPWLLPRLTVANRQRRTIRSLRVRRRRLLANARRRRDLRAFRAQIRRTARATGTKVDAAIDPSASVRGVRLELRGPTTRLVLGPRSTLHEGVLLRLWGGDLELARNAEVRHDACLTVKGTLRLGPRVSIGRGSNVHCDATMNWGFGATTGEHVTVVDSEHRTDGSPIAVFDHPITVARTDIGPGSFLGAGSVITAGIEVGTGAVVGAGAVVTRNVAPGHRVGGVPARVLGGPEDA